MPRRSDHHFSHAPLDVDGGVSAVLVSMVTWFRPDRRQGHPEDAPLLVVPALSVHAAQSMPTEPSAPPAAVGDADREPRVERRIRAADTNAWLTPPVLAPNGAAS